MSGNFQFVFIRLGSGLSPDQAGSNPLQNFT
jgi:hypothetical protein